MVVLAARFVTTASSPSTPSRSVTRRRSSANGTRTAASTTVSVRRIVELRIVSDASFSFGTTRRSPFGARSQV